MQHLGCPSPAAAGRVSQGVQSYQLLLQRSHGNPQHSRLKVRFVQATPGALFTKGPRKRLQLPTRSPHPPLRTPAPGMLRPAALA